MLVTKLSIGDRFDSDVGDFMLITPFGKGRHPWLDEYLKLVTNTFHIQYFVTYTEAPITI